MPSNVPKFSSFRPKPKPLTEPSEKAARLEVRTESSSKSKASGEKVTIRPSEPPKAERDGAASKLYFSDRRGDVNIVKYGSLDRYDTPIYRRCGYGYVLGLGLDLKIDRDRSSHSKTYIVPIAGPQKERLLTSKNVPRDYRRTLRIMQSHSTPISAEGQDFIAVSDGHKSPHGDSDDNGDDQVTNVDYRGIERDQSQPFDPDTEYVHHIEEGTSTTELAKKNSALARRTKEQPGDVQTWLDFIEHQEAILSVADSGHELSGAVRQQLADVRIQICEDALKKVPNSSDSRVKLYLVLLREARRSWPDSKLTAKWQEVLNMHAESPRLWLMYLDYVQSSFLPFKYEACCNIFLQCFSALQHTKDVAMTTILHVFVRMTSLMHSAGYQELALAIWQATLECSLSHPPMTPAETHDFDQFWESEAPRIGEDGALGWRKTVHDKMHPSDTLMQPQTPGVSVFEDFHLREQDLIGKLRYPGRTSDEIGEDDAFHTIFFSDIEPYMKLWSMRMPVNSILEAFLCFCGLPSLTHGGEHQQMWWDNPFKYHVHTQPRIKVPGESEEGDNVFAVQNVPSLSDCKRGNFQMTSDLLLEQDFSLLGTRLHPEFVRRILRLAVAETKDEVLGEYLLAFEHGNYPADVVKTAKQVLKTQPTSQRLYNIYGLIEARRGDTDKANQVFSMSLAMDHAGSYGSLNLLSSWVWLALQRNNTTEALWRLTSRSGKIPTRPDATTRPDPNAIQTASNCLREACEAALLGQDYPAAVIGTSLSAVIAYLSSDCSIGSAVDTHQRLSDWFASHKLETSPHAELNAQALARILTWHITFAPIVKPMLIKDALEPVIARFPNNAILLSLHAANEARFAINDRVRSTLHASSMRTAHDISAAGWLFAIEVESRQADVSGVTSHSLRTLFKRATHPDSTGAHSPAIWASYLEFERQQIRAEQSRVAVAQPRKDGKKRSWDRRLEEAEARAKETFYAGMRSLPWCKDFIMLAFEDDMRRVFSEEELWKIYRVMQEKELRIYVELDQD